ncbi:methyltransferase domain-containing protein [Kutzneria kofuensis]|uniref:Methyltransferase family protein n=1 Tax=Kutzneria kofuensis TaxID=103725 RepID=A0A7W9NJ59_9PSEU|nr:methyltransferase domain-containing protein [Kutzneria kofuensis]MBB5895312.1 hypothetical protein [Kutzneria kofuensis]
MPEAAELYNAMNPWADRADERFYLGLALAAASVLDVGCGTGTLLSQARAAGHAGRLVGFDPDAVMTGHAFQCLLTDSDVLTTLRGVRDALTPAGRFVFETRNPAARAWEQWPEGGFEFPWEGKPVRVHYEVQPIVGDVVDVVENIVGDGWRRADWGRIRFLSVERLGELLTEAGLVVEERYGDWDRSPVTPDSAEIISVVRWG